MDISKIPPKQIVLDLVLRYSPVIRQCTDNEYFAMVFREGEKITLMIMAKNHLRHPVGLNVSCHLSGPTTNGLDGNPARFVLYKIAPTVWKLSQSVLDEKIHAYVTIVGVPEPAPWEV